MNSFINRYWLVGIQGFLSGLPFAAITNALQARFIAANASIVLIGSLSLISQIYLYKFLLAPLSDSVQSPVHFGAANQNRDWICFNQLALIIVLFAMALLSARQTPLLLILIAFATAFFSAFQDVNIDSYRIQLLKPKELDKGSTCYLLGFRLGMIIAGGISIIIGVKLNWHLAYALLASLMTIGLILTSMNEGIPKKTTKPAHFYQTFYTACLDLKNRPHAGLLLLFMVLYGLGDAFTINVNNAFLVRAMHFSFSELAFYANTLNIAMLLLSTVLARYCLERFKLRKCLVAFSGAQLIMLLLYLAAAQSGASKLIAIWAILIEGLSGGLIATALIVVISKATHKPYTTTQYALLSALAALKNVLLGPIAAGVVHYTSWADLYLLGVILTLPGTYLAWHITKLISQKPKPFLTKAMKSYYLDTA